MWDVLPEIKELLKLKRYSEAEKKLKLKISKAFKEEQSNEIVRFLKKELLFLNMTGDKNQTTLFCNKLMKYTLDLGIDFGNYIEQCKLLNRELDWYGEQYKSVIQSLYSLDPYTAIHIILATFENLNQFLLASKPDEMERMFYSMYVHGMEANYESGISALNRLLILWSDGFQKGHFRGKFSGLPNDSEQYIEFREKLAPIVRGLNYLEWLCKQVSIQDVLMEINDDEVVFATTSYNEYIKYQLPFIRDASRMQNVLRKYPMVRERFGWQIKDIDFSSIIQIKETGDDFRLLIDPNTFIEAFKRTTESAYQSNLLIIQDTYITNMHELKLKDSNISLSELFLFYYCLKTFALIYFESTQYFIEKYGKEAKAPHLVTDKESISKYFIPLLTTILKRPINQDNINEMLEVYTFGSNSIYDLYYKPVIVKNEKVIIIPSLFMMNNFPKTFLHHMNQLKVNLADRGSNFEIVISKLFSNHDFKVHSGPYPFVYNYEDKEIKGDIDLIAMKGKNLFIGQLKNRIEPLEPQDYRGADKKINKGIIQAEEAELYIKRNLEEFCEIFGIEIEEMKDVTMVPFVLVSCFYGSGQNIRNIPVTDASSLHRFFNEGEINIYPGDGEPYTRKIRSSGKVLPNELEDFLNKPYFLDPEIYGIQMSTNHVYEIRNRIFKFGPQDDWEEKFARSFLAEAIQHFKEIGVLEN